MVEYENTIEDYMQIIIRYGYVIIFSPCITWAPLLVLILSVVEIRVDAYKLCNLHRRPLPLGRESIGQWNNIIDRLCHIGIFFNAALICWTSEAFDAYEEERFVCFFIVYYILLAFSGLANLMKNESTYVKRAKIWQKRIVDERLNNKNINIEKDRKARKLDLTGRT